MYDLAQKHPQRYATILTNYTLQLIASIGILFPKGTRLDYIHLRLIKNVEL